MVFQNILVVAEIKHTVINRGTCRRDGAAPAGLSLGVFGCPPVPNVGEMLLVGRSVREKKTNVNMANTKLAWPTRKFLQKASEHLHAHPC